MKCPKCGLENSPTATACRQCGEPLTPEKTEEQASRRKVREKGYGFLFWLLCWLIMIPLAGLGIYKTHFWIESYKTTKAYEHKQVALVENISMDYNKPGHAVTIFGDDGDVIYVKELGESYTVIGGLVRVEVEDAFWFDRDPEAVSRAEVVLTATKYRENGTVEDLPLIEFSVDTPYAPVTLVRPSTVTTTVYASVYKLQMNVVPGSTVLINGEDVSDQVDREGDLSVNVNVYPQGDNYISLYASTDYHKDTRMDVILYRPVMDVALELSANTTYSSTRTLYTVTGTIDPAAELVVDTAHDAESVTVDPETGKFEFKAKFSTIGYNTVRFRAVKEGCNDSIISFQVYYLPSIAEYSRNAWIMDYSQLCLLYEQWTGRVFQCIGTIYDVFTIGDTQYVVMNVGNNETTKLVVLENMSGTAQFESGLQYRAYADVSGDYYYEAKNYPLLIARYLDIYAAK